MKYIDAEKLLAEIERLRKEHTTIEYRDEAALVLEDLEDYIDSLQQEPVEKKNFDDYLKAIPAERRKMNMTEILGAEKLAKIKEMMEQEQPEFPTTDEQVKEFLAAHPKIKVPEKYKNPDWLFKKQEQPETRKMEGFIEGLSTAAKNYQEGYFDGYSAAEKEIYKDLKDKMEKHHASQVDYGVHVEQKTTNYTKRNALFDKCVENCDPKIMKEVSDNVDKLKSISTPAEEDWFKISEEWEKEDKQSVTDCNGLIELSWALSYEIDRCITDLLLARFDKDEQHERKELSRMESLMVDTQQHLSCIVDYLEKHKEDK